MKGNLVASNNSPITYVGDVSKNYENQELSLLIKKASKEVLMMAKEINLMDTLKVAEFGSSATDKINSLSDRILSSFTIKDLTVEKDDIVSSLKNLLTDVDIKEIIELSEKKEKRNILFKFFDKTISSAKDMFEKYSTLDKEVKKIEVKLGKYQNEIQKSNVDLENLYTESLSYIKVLNQYRLAGIIASKKVTEELIPKLEQKINEYDEYEKFNHIQDIDILRDNIDILNLRLNDIATTILATAEMLPQIKMLTKNNTSLFVNLKSKTNEVLPTLKRQIITSVNISRQYSQSKSLEGIEDLINDLMMRNVEMLGELSLDIQEKSANRGIKISTIEHCLNSLELTLKKMEDNKRRLEIESSKNKEEMNRFIQNAKSLSYENNISQENNFNKNNFNKRQLFLEI